MEGEEIIKELLQENFLELSEGHMFIDYCHCVPRAMILKDRPTPKYLAGKFQDTADKQSSKLFRTDHIVKDWE